MRAFNRVLLGASGIAAIMVSMFGHAEAANRKITIATAHPTPVVTEDVYVYGVPMALGYYAEEGLEIEFQGSSGSGASLQMVEAGSVLFGAAESDAVLQAREQGAKAKAFYTLKQRSSYTIGVLPDSPIKQLSDLKGKKIGSLSLGVGAVGVTKASLEAIGIPATDYTLIATGGGAPAAVALREGRVDALGVPMWAFGRMENDGMTLRYITLPANSRKAGFTLVATDATLEKEKKAAIGICRAISRGLYFALQNPVKAIELFYKTFPQAKPQNVNVDAQAKADLHILQGFLADAVLEGPNEQLGSLSEKRWTEAAKFIQELGIYQGKAKVQDAMTEAFGAECNNFDRAAIERQARN